MRLTQHTHKISSKQASAFSQYGKLYTSSTTTLQLEQHLLLVIHCFHIFFITSNGDCSPQFVVLFRLTVFFLFFTFFTCQIQKQLQTYGSEQYFLVCVLYYICMPLFLVSYKRQGFKNMLTNRIHDGTFYFNFLPTFQENIRIYY